MLQRDPSAAGSPCRCHPCAAAAARRRPSPPPLAHAFPPMIPAVDALMGSAPCHSFTRVCVEQAELVRRLPHPAAGGERVPQPPELRRPCPRRLPRLPCTTCSRVKQICWRGWAGSPPCSCPPLPPPSRLPLHQPATAFCPLTPFPHPHRPQLSGLYLQPYQGATQAGAVLGVLGACLAGAAGFIPTYAAFAANGGTYEGYGAAKGATLVAVGSALAALFVVPRIRFAVLGMVFQMAGFLLALRLFETYWVRCRRSAAVACMG